MDRKAQLAQLGERARAMYQQLRSTVETEDQIGKVIALDLDSGDYEIDEKLLPAADRLRSRRPQANLYGMRIGYRGYESFAGMRSLGSR